MSMVATAQQTASSITHIQQKIFQPLASTSEVLPTNNSLNAQPIPQSQEQNEQQTMQKEATTMSQNLALPQSSSYRQTQTGYRFKTTMRQQDRLLEDLPEGPGRRLRKNVANVRKHIDYVANVLNHMEARLWQTTKADRLTVQPDILYQSYVLPPASTPDTPVDCVLTKFIRSAMNKVKCPVYSLCWTPEGKRLITGASSGEFTLWNGTAFNFETILQAHDVAIRAMKWSHNDQWLASADHDGFVKYWQPNFNNVHMFQAHKDEPIRSISFCPTDVKLVTGSDDATARIWDFARCSEERVLRGHGADVRSVDWHPTKGLLATGSRDSQQPVKLWDAKTGQCLATLHDHKNSVMSVQWNKNGNWLLTGSRDHVIKLYDVRMMREMQSFRGHKKEVTALAWHPVHEGLFVSGGGDGSLGYWLVSSDKELALLEQAHDQAIWTLEWHPLGHILATGSNDNNTKFWSRNRPGDTQEDIFGMTTVGGVLTSTSVTTTEEDREAVAEEPIVPVIPGMGLDELMKREMNQDVSAIPPLSLPGLGGQTNASQDQQGQGRRPGQGRHQPKRNHRQFERMWTVARPSGGTESTMDDYGPPDGGMADPANYGNNAHGPMDGGMFRGGFYPQQQSLNTPHHQMPPPQHLPPPQHPLPQRPPPHLQMNMKRFPPPRRYF